MGYSPHRLLVVIVHTFLYPALNSSRKKRQLGDPSGFNFLTEVTSATPLLDPSVTPESNVFDELSSPLSPEAKSVDNDSTGLTNGDSSNAINFGADPFNDVVSPDARSIDGFTPTVQIIPQG